MLFWTALEAFTNGCAVVAAALAECDFGCEVANSSDARLPKPVDGRGHAEVAALEQLQRRIRQQIRRFHISMDQGVAVDVGQTGEELSCVALKALAW